MKEELPKPKGVEVESIKHEQKTVPPGTMTRTEEAASDFREERLADWERIGKKGWLEKKVDAFEDEDGVKNERLIGEIEGREVQLTKSDRLGDEKYGGHVYATTEEGERKRIELTPEEARKLYRTYEMLAVPTQLTKNFEEKAGQERSRDWALKGLFVDDERR